MTAPTCCGLRMVTHVITGEPCCIVCMGDPEIQARHAEPDDEEKGWSLGYRLPRNRQDEIVAEWDAAAYQREDPFGKGV